MKKFGLIQPGRNGDLIILIPAMKHMHDMGYEIYWPIFENYIPMYKDLVNYINFIPVRNNVYTAVPESYDLLRNKYCVDTIVDVAATFPGSVCTEEYVRSGDGYGENYDAFKYRLLNIPIDIKWKFSECIVRNDERENIVRQAYVMSEKYVVANMTCSSGKVNVNIDTKGLPRIDVTMDYSMFDWIGILEKADTIVLLNSGMLCLVEQMNMTNRKIVLKIPNGRLPVLRNKWEIIDG